MAQGDLAHLALHLGGRGSPPSTTPPPGINTLRAPASAACSVTPAARSGLSATTTLSGTLGQRRQVGVAGRAPRFVVVRVHEVAGRGTTHRDAGCRGRSGRCRERGDAPTTAIERGAKSA